MPLDANAMGQQQGMTTLGALERALGLMSPFNWASSLGQSMWHGLTEVPKTTYETGQLPDPGTALLWGTNAIGAGMPFAAKGALGSAGGRLTASGMGQSQPFYSALREFVSSAPIERAPPKQWLGMLRKAPGVKAEELEWTGFQKWLEGQGDKVSKSDALGFLEDNRVDVQEVVLGDQIGDGPTKFSQYQLPGGENYRELLLTMPGGKTADWSKGSLRGNQAIEAGTFRGGHYDEPNVLAHVRFNDRVDAQGKKTLFVEEVQSDWHQKGRKQGYKSGEIEKALEVAKAKATEAERVFDDMQRKYGMAPHEAGSAYVNAPLNSPPRGIIPEAKSAVDEAFIIQNQLFRAEDAAKAARKEATELERKGLSEVPDAPFKTTWPDLALKRMVKWAVDNGYDQIAWTPGKVQAERYDLSKHLNSIGYQKRGDLYNISAFDKNDNRVWNNQSATLKDIEDHVGKEMAEKISKGEGRKYTTSTGHLESGVTYLEDLDLQVGGEGMNAFYDKMLPAAANKLGKKYGAKAGVTRIGSANDIPKDSAFRQEAWFLPITDAMRKEVGAKGMPLFTGGVPLGANAMGQQQGVTPEMAQQWLRGQAL